jgi:hypothetical protein
MRRLRAIAALFVAVVALATAVSSAAAAEQEGPFFQVKVPILVHGCFKTTAKGNYKTKEDCEHDENFAELAVNEGWLQGCEQRPIGIYATEANCLDFKEPVFVANGWSALALFHPLGAGSTRLLLATAKEKFTLESKSVGITITCTGLTLPEAGQMQIQGVAAGNGGTSKEALEFTGCIVTGNGEPCEVEGKKVKTATITNTLGYGNASRTGPVLVLFQPEKGTNFVTVKFTGVGCKFKDTPVEGSTVGAAQVGGSPVVIGKEPEETLHGEVKFPHVQLIFIEKEKSLKHVKAGLKAFGVASTLSGTALLLVDENGAPVKWGIFT